MNNDLISREALKEALKEKFDDFIPEGVYDEIDNAPTVDIKDEIAGAYNEGYMCGNKEAEKARPQGEWINQGIVKECNKCHCGCLHTIIEKIVYGELNFCPNCGAEMRKGGAE